MNELNPKTSENFNNGEGQTDSSPVEKGYFNWIQ